MDHFTPLLTTVWSILKMLFFITNGPHGIKMGAGIIGLIIVIFSGALAYLENRILRKIRNK
jgi:hypothetical protein